MTELLTTEGRYVQDLEEVLLNYRDKLAVSNLTETRVRAEALFGNLDEIHAFHARSDHQFILSTFNAFKILLLSSQRLIRAAI